MNRLVITLAFTAAAFAQTTKLPKVSVKNFGAAGDGVTDDTVAIQNGLNAVCGAKLAIATTTGRATSPIVVTTATPHNFANGAPVIVAGVNGNGNANGTWTAAVLSPTAVALYSPLGYASIGNAEFISGGVIASPPASGLYFPAGTYHISSPLVTRCDTSIAGAGPTASIIFQTHQYIGIHGIIANYSLNMLDIAVNTTPLAVNYGMGGVFAGTTPSEMGTNRNIVRLTRFHSSGFNFGIVASGSSDIDLIASVLVDQCQISISSEMNSVSQPVNAANATALTVTNSTLDGNSVSGGDVFNDHAIYTIAVRGILIQNNVIRNNGNSAIKLLQGGFHSETCPTNQDYTSWIIDHNQIQGARIAIAVYSYCGLVLPSVVISRNQVSNILNPYLGDFAAVYIQANCHSNMHNVASFNNRFTNLGLGGIVLISQVQADNACLDTTAQGTVSNFSSTNDTFVGWSQSAKGVFPAINSRGANLMLATITGLSADVTADGNPALSLSSFQNVQLQAQCEANCGRRTVAEPLAGPRGTRSIPSLR